MTTIAPFQLERYFALYEFSAPYLLSPSDCESLRLPDLLAMADQEMISLWQNLGLGYTESSGHPLLRETIAGLYTSAQPADILVMAPEEAIFIAMQTLLSPGDEIVAVHPAYQSLHEVARSIGCQVNSWPLVHRDGGWHLDLQILEDQITSRTRLLVINFPHNPTGFIPTLNELSRILELARRHHLFVFSDEMYRMLEYSPEQRLPAVCDLYEMGISLSGMSKSFSMPGLRIGWLATRAPGWIERWQTYKDYTTICNSAPSEVLAIMGLRARRRILERNLAIIQKNFTTADQFFRRHADRFTWIPPLAGSVAFPQWTGVGPVEKFCQDLVTQTGVMLVPGNLFGATGNHFRLGLGRKNFSEGLSYLEQFLLAN